jgi:hypothetical protein
MVTQLGPEDFEYAGAPTPWWIEEKVKKESREKVIVRFYPLEVEKKWLQWMKDLRSKKETRTLAHQIFLCLRWFITNQSIPKSIESFTPSAFEFCEKDSKCREAWKDRYSHCFEKKSVQGRISTIAQDRQISLLFSTIDHDDFLMKFFFECLDTIAALRPALSLSSCPRNEFRFTLSRLRSFSSSSSSSSSSSLSPTSPSSSPSPSSSSPSSFDASSSSSSPVSFSFAF